MNYAVNVYCKRCHRDGLVRIKLGILRKTIEEVYPCPHCDTKGTITTVRH